MMKINKGNSNFMSKTENIARYVIFMDYKTYY